MSHEPNAFESSIFEHYRLQKKAKTINDAIKILIKHNYIVIDLEGNFIKKD